MRAKISAVLLLLASAAFCRADSQSFGGQWGGLNNSDSAILIGDNEAQDLLNVDITDNGSGIRKRSGYSQFKTIGTSTWGVRGGYYFTDTSGNKFLINANNRSVYKSQNSGAYSAFITTDTAGTYYDFTDSQGYLYRATSDRDEFCRYDGTTLVYYPLNPKGNQIEAMPDRLVISGVAAYPNRVYFSGAADFTNFTTGINETDPFYEVFGLPGQKITAIKNAIGRLFAWTSTTLSYWSGFSQFDGTIQDVSTNIGTTQPGSVISDNGVVYWQGNDKHFYSYDGNALDRISTPISGSVSGFVGGDSKLAIQTTQTDFEQGTKSDALTFSESPGFVTYLANGTLFDDFSDNDCTSSPPWVFNYYTSGSSTCASGLMDISQSASSSRTIMTSTISFNLGDSLVFDNYYKSYSVFSVSLCTSAITSTQTLPTNGCYTADMTPQFAGTAYASIYKNGVFVVGVSTVGGRYSETTSQNFAFSISPSNYISLSKNGTELLGTTDSTYSGFSYISIGMSGYLTGDTHQYVDNIYVKKATGTFVSSAFSIGSAISSWGLFSAESTKTGNASIAYAIYSDTNTSIDVQNSATFISSQTITPPAIPTISTATYLVYRATFTRTASTETVSLDSVSIEWNEGTITHTYGYPDSNHRLVWSLAENNSTTNNATYIYDQRFKTWLKYSFALDAPAQIGETTYFGGPSTGVVYYFPSGTSDNGAAITAYWKSKDFIGGDPFVEKNYKNYSLIAKTQAGSTLSLEYALNGSATSTTRTISLTNSSGIPYIRNNGIFDNGTIGSFVNFKFGNTGSDNPFEVYSVKYDYMPRAWRVMP